MLWSKADYGEVVIFVSKKAVIIKKH